MKLVAFIPNIVYNQVCHSNISPKKEITGKRMSTVEIVIVHRIIMHKSHIVWGFAWNQHGTGGNFTYSAYCIMHRMLK